MALFWVDIITDSVSLLEFPFRSHVQVIIIIIIIKLFALHPVESIPNSGQIKTLGKVIVV